MTATKLPELQVSNKTLTNTSWNTKRRVTDKLGLICFISILLIWLYTWAYVIYVLRESIFSCGYIDWLQNINRSCESFHTNSSSDAINQLTLSINSTIHAFNANKLLFSGNYFWSATKLVEYTTRGYFMVQFFWTAVEIFSKCERLRCATHFVVVNTGKVLTTLIVSTVFFTRYSSIHQWSFNELSIFWIPELCTYSISLTLIAFMTLSKLNNEFKFNKRALRDFLNCRYLLLFRALILMIMVALVMAVIIILSYDLHKKSMLSLLCIITGTVYMIFHFHNYGKMITMTVSAYNDWCGDGKLISIKDILLAMFTIGKYHLGTICLNTIFMRRLYTLRDMSNLPQSDAIIQHYGETMDVVAHIVDRSAILTAIHGQNFDEATTNIIRFEMEQKKILDSKSLSSIVYEDMSHNSFSITVVLAMMPIPDVQTLLFRILALAIFFSVRGIYNYVVTTMDSISYARKYCKEENKLDSMSKANQKLTGIS